MKVLMISKEHYVRSGVSRHTFELTELLEGHGHEVIHFSMAHPDNEASPYSKYFVSQIDFSELRYSPMTFFRNFGRMLWSFEAAKKMEALLDEVKPDVAHIHNIYHHISPSILPVLKRHGVPVVQTLHDYKLMCPNYLMLSHGEVCERCKYRRYYEPMFQTCVKNSVIASGMVGFETAFHKLIGVYENNIDLFLTPSKFLKDKLATWRIKAKRVEQLYNFVYPPKEVPVKKGDYILYGLARLSREKGLWTLLKAAKDLPQVPFKIWGVGPLGDELKKFARQREVKNVEFVGDPKGGIEKEILPNARAVVVPSEYYENNAYAIIEAMSYGRAVITSDIGGNPELIEAPKRGLLFAPREVSDLKAQILRLWDDPDFAVKMGSAGREFVVENLNAEKYYEEIIKKYASVQPK